MPNIFFVLSHFLIVSIYSFHVQSSDGHVIDLRKFQGRKLLIVNTASGSAYANQYGSLQQLYRKYQGNLVILAFPSNDFGNEPLTDSAIRSSVVATYQVGYILADKGSVQGPNSLPLYQWLGDASQNGSISSPVNGDFFKYLIDENGNLRGVFAGSVDPVDSVVQDAISASYN